MRTCIALSSRNDKFNNVPAEKASNKIILRVTSLF